jgi:hypothetical protein
MRKLKKHEHHEIILRTLLGLATTLILDIKEEKNYQARILFLDVCEEVLILFSQRFFRSYFFIPYLGLSRDTVPNVRLRFIEVLPLVRHTIRIPADQIILSKLVDTCDSLAFRDTDRGVVASMNEFLSNHGSLAAANCCQYPEAESLAQTNSIKDSKKTFSQGSLTDGYFKTQMPWESLPLNEVDKLKEEAEQKTQYFLLDPSKRHGLLKTTGPKKAASVTTASPLKKPVLTAKKEVAPSTRKELTPVSTITSKIANLKPPGTPLIAKESTIPRVAKPIAKKGIYDLTQTQPTQDHLPLYPQIVVLVRQRLQQ